VIKIELRLCASVLALVGSPAFAQSQQNNTEQPAKKLEDMDIKDLVQLPVTTVSKVAEPTLETPASLYVIRNYEITESAGLTIPELLRAAPQLSVQRINQRQYSIAARGFNGYETSNKILALIDGRTIYTPLHSAVFWDLHQPLVEDIAQIEVVSGPGGTLYGPNAMNGVINVISKSSQDTLGLLARASMGTEDKTAAVRYGFQMGNNATARVYVNYYDVDSFAKKTDFSYNDAEKGFQAGFRADAGTGANLFTLQGDYFRAKTYVIKGDDQSGGNVVARWTHDLAGAGSLQVQAYYDKYQRQSLLVADSLETLDSTVQYTNTFYRHQIVAGVGVRTTKDSFVNNLNGFNLSPLTQRLWDYNGFIQDKFSVTNRIALTVGAKLEKSTFSGVEFLPNVRFAYQMNPNHLFWGAVSKAVRTPSRIDRQLQFLPLLAPSTNFKSEKLTAFEMGYKGQPLTDVAVSVTGFYNLYDDIRTTELTQAGGLPITLENGLKGSTYGVEAFSAIQLTHWWRLKPGVLYLHKNFHVKEWHSDISNEASLGDDPSYEVRVRSEFDVTDNMNFNLALRRVGALKASHVPDYTEADAFLNWRLSPKVELYVSGNNLLHKHHLENSDDQAVPNYRMVRIGTRIRL
jgi:iron complex outermembrane receptor protein